MPLHFGCRARWEGSFRAPLLRYTGDIEDKVRIRAVTENPSERGKTIEPLDYGIFGSTLVAKPCTSTRLSSWIRCYCVYFDEGY